jgi:DeoR/GlpR family transcriptional regulator of sugar metabolism
MHPKHRQEFILSELVKQQFLTYEALAGLLDVSEMTVRRDVQTLSRRDLVTPVLGGVELPTGSSKEPAYKVKLLISQPEKQSIAVKAMELVEPNMTIGFTAGTTTWAIAKRIRNFTNLSFVTNSTNIALELNNNGWSDIILTGGNFRTPSDALVGPIAEYTARQLHTNVLFLGVHGIDLAYGISTPNIAEASIDRILMENADKVVLVFDHTKWGIKALARISNLQLIHAIVTDDQGREEELEQMRKLGIKVLLAPMGNQHSIQVISEIQGNKE